MLAKKDKSKHGPAPRPVDSPQPQTFDINAPALPRAIGDAKLTSGRFPYATAIDTKAYLSELRLLQIELLKLQRHIQAHGLRLVVLFEGRDAAGKGGCIARVLEHLNKRHARAVALTKPSDTERGQWYFQRYIAHLPTAGDIVLFDRSWYNRAGVERVMGFCTADQVADFMREAPQFEDLLVRDDIKLVKFFLKIGKETQLARFHARRHDPLKTWKLTDVDLAAIDKWDDYSAAIADIFRFTHTATSPWTVVLANDKKRARLAVIKALLAAFDYDGKDETLAQKPDPRLVGSGGAFFEPW